MSEWEIIDTGVNSAEQNMRFDAELLEHADQYKRPVLHLYEWAEDSATYGYFINPSDFLNLEKSKEVSLNLARRPTGGGIIFHLWDMAFSVLVPADCPEFSSNTLQNYALINRAVLAAIKDFLCGRPELSLTPIDYSAIDPKCSHFCMAKPTKYDVMWVDKKVAGAAQRKTKKGFLHQGSISLMLPPKEYLAEVLIAGTKVEQAMQQYSCPLLGTHVSQDEMAQAKEQLRKLLATHLTSASLSLRA